MFFAYSLVLLKNIQRFIGTFRAESEVLAVEFLDLFDPLYLVFGHIAHHFATRHLDINAFFFSVRIQKAHIDQRLVGPDAFCVFLAGQIQDHLVVQRVRDLFVPERIQGAGRKRKLCLHFQTVFRDLIERPDKAVQSGKDAQVLVHIIKLFIGEYAGSHILKRDSGITEQGTPPVGMFCMKEVVHFWKHPFADLHRLFQCVWIKGGKFLAQQCAFLLKKRRCIGKLKIALELHLFRWRNNNFHGYILTHFLLCRA